MGGALEAGGLPGPTDAWITLAGLARDTSTIRLGTLVTSATFRLPGPLAGRVAEVDQMSGGRVELGLGAGWYEREHEAYGIPFPPLGERFDRLEEQLEVITGFWSTPVGERFDHRRRRLARRRLAGAPQAGAGRRRADHRRRRRPDSAHRRWRPASPPSSTPRSCTLERFVEQRERVAAPAPSIGRDADELVYSAALVACVGDDEVDVERRAAAIGRDAGELRENGVAGTVDEARATLERWQEAGAERIYLQVLDLSDLDHLETLASICA